MSRNAVVTLDDGFQDNYEHALPILSRLKVPATVFLTVGYIGTDRLPTLTRTDFMPRPLDWREVKEMQAQGIEFGSHTITHPMLSQVSLDVARREIGESKRMLEDRLGTDGAVLLLPSRRRQRSGEAHRPRRGISGGLLDACPDSTTAGPTSLD